MSKIKRIGITTGGGDAPGLNGVIRAVTLAACRRDWECVGIRHGFDGILHADEFEDGGTIALTPVACVGSGILAVLFWVPPIAAIHSPIELNYRTGALKTKTSLAA